jgi:hypothetical protein
MLTIQKFRALAAEDIFRANCSETLDNGCILWGGRPNRRGLGQIHCNGKDMIVHEYAWVLEYGDIPDGYVVIHSCENDLCVNHEHLFLLPEYCRCPCGEVHPVREVCKK